MKELQFKSLVDFIGYFADETACQKYFEQIRFRDGEYCPHCANAKIYRYDNGKRFRCAACKKDFTIKTGTVFGESKISLQKWFVAIYLLSTAKKGISSVQLAKQVGVTQKTAWFMDHRIRQAMKQNGGQLFGKVEVDETYIGGKERNKHRNKRTPNTQGRNTLTKAPVVGLLQRGGELRASVVKDVKMRTLESVVATNVKMGSELITDDFRSYSRISRLFPHEVVKHGQGEYVREGGIHSNSAESFWAIFKRGYVGTYHHMSRKHLQGYVDEFVYRFNFRLADFDQMFGDLVCKVSDSDKLTYKGLTQ